MSEKRPIKRLVVLVDGCESRETKSKCLAQA
jgi:hypothetical protein